MMDAPDVLIRTEGRWGHITLNRPRALNALSYEMCCAIDDALAAWRSDATIIGVLIDGAGERGFCAGGDIRALYQAAIGGDAASSDIFFAREYRLNARIANFPKPYVALMDGITMGGGVGLSAHGSHRIVTERTILAMPEVGIGFIPDVGATHLLGRVPDQLGTHVALTAMRLSPADALAIDLADHQIPASRLDDLRQDIFASDTITELDPIIHRYATLPAPSALLAQRAWIKKCYQRESITEILHHLGTAGPAAAAAATIIAAQSPTAVRLALRALREARAFGTLEPCLQQEYRLAVRCTRAHDFIEGVRAAVVDKDRNPQWQPRSDHDIDDATIDEYFAPLGAAELQFD
ncbi:MAG: 3-hydroxyisobutyryl-CoA hydrolase [Acidiphilium sp. 37-64-53]|uniref:enoyl-CoA hydratase/isomerase family protein n=2 Tax=Acidocellaceae TaxID=3385905 RepID=UPI000BC8E921|nr:enoyl-CoA hydratase/isomerase family protein [Acidiphilium sp.]OYW03322.1 MAG: 3-hydroxyisobutyryl-CoA hydrolase [Acidiphilium sp. 37-64-53]OZB30105.1 MAG: 3-hydroxyisobutyryl-CoA hydrolase [Acidiphilium sp. 34-64-41]HQT84864.1 enoyl-CoA hydratase/isomerase family protein [Acidiphilium rubrum]